MLESTIQRIKDNDQLLASEIRFSTNTINNADVINLAKALESNTLVRKLYIIGSGIGDIGIKAMADALKTNKALIELTIRNFDQNDHDRIINDESMQYLANALKDNYSLAKIDIGAHSAEIEDIIKRNNSFTNKIATTFNIEHSSFFGRCLKVISDNAKYIGYAMLAAVGCCALVYCTKKFQLNFKDGVLNSILNSLSTTEVSR